MAVQSLWNIRLAVFVKPEHEGCISQVNTASVKTGLGNTLGTNLLFLKQTSTLTNELTLLFPLFSPPLYFVAKENKPSDE